jgi:hypothetical protein
MQQEMEQGGKLFFDLFVVSFVITGFAWYTSC